MPTIVPLSDAGDDRLGPYTHLTDAQMRRQIEGRAGLFLVEGVNAIERLLASHYEVHSLLLTPARLERLHGTLAPHDVPVYVVPQAVMNDVVGFDIHRGALAAAVRPIARDAAALLRRSRTVAIGEDLNDHENLGAIARSAVALGVDALLLSPGSADPLYRRSVRVSMGEMLFLPYAVLDPWPAALTDVVAAAGFRIVAMSPSGELAIDDISLGPHERIAVLLGAEGPGLTAAAMGAAHDRVRITIRPGVDSLNVGHAAAIAFHHFGRAASAANPHGGDR